MTARPAALYVEPSAADIESAQQFQGDLARQRDLEYQTRYQPAIMTDGHRVEVVGQHRQASEAAQAASSRAPRVSG